MFVCVAAVAVAVGVVVGSGLVYCSCSGNRCFRAVIVVDDVAVARVEFAVADVAVVVIVVFAAAVHHVIAAIFAAAAADCVVGLLLVLIVSLGVVSIVVDHVECCCLRQ